VKKRMFKRSLIISFVIAYIFVSLSLPTKVEAKGVYSIKYNKTTNVVTVYKNNKPYKAFLASGGYATPIGTFYTSVKYRWHELMGPTYGQYCMRITGHVLFHSIWYYRNYDKSSQSVAQYNKLGTLCSHGCIRLNVADSKWLYDNCPVGTKVTIFNGSKKSDPFKKPTFVKVKSNKKSGWDPTDPDKANPFRKITIANVSSKTVKVNYKASVSLRKKVSAKDKAGNNLNKYLKVYVKEPNGKYKVYKNNKLKFTKIGTYSVVYSVTSPYNKVNKKVTVKYTVKDTKKPTLTGMEKSKKVTIGTKKNIRKNVVAKNSYGASLTKYIKIMVKTPSTKKASLYKKSELTFSKVGNYVVTYSVTNPKNKLSTTKTIVFNCIDNRKPIIKGLANKTVEYGTKYNVLNGVSAKSYTGVDLSKKISVEVVSPSKKKVALSNYTFVCNEEGKYTLTYRVSNAQKKETVVKITVTVNKQQADNNESDDSF